MTERIRDLAFISYHQADRDWLERLEIHLKPLFGHTAQRYWSDTCLSPGEDRSTAAEHALRRACVVILLISADYLVSAEMQRMLAAARAYKATLLWLPVRSSAYEGTALGTITPLLAPGRTLGLLTREEAERELVEVGKRIAKAVQTASVRSPVSSAVPRCCGCTTGCFPRCSTWPECAPGRCSEPEALARKPAALPLSTIVNNLKTDWRATMGESLVERAAIVREQLPQNTLFVILGFLEEYAGRRVTHHGERVETFGADEATPAKRFEGYLKRLSDEHQLPTTLRHEVVGKCSHFYSRELTALIDAFYLTHGLTGSNSDGSPAYTKGAGVVRSHAGRMAIGAFPEHDHEARLSYLSGAHQRWGKQNSFKLAYGFHKVQLIKKLLLEVGSTNVVIVYPDPDLMPAVYQVAFEPTPELIERLDIEVQDELE